MTAILELDRSAFLYLNGIHNEFFDWMMYWASDRFIWIPLYIFLGIMIITKWGKPGILYLASIAILILIVDQSITAIIKPFFGRLRPCHDALVAPSTYLVSGCGGIYSFFSGHAANTFAIATFIDKTFNRPVSKLMYLWAGVIAYSRIYLGVHYPLDILVGSIYGLLLGAFFYRLAQYSHQRIFKPL